MIAPMTPSEPDDASGAGADAYLTPVQRNKIVSMMLNPRRRWKLTKEAKNAAMSATLDNLTDDDARVRNGAVSNMIRMEGQNMADQHKALDKHSPDLDTGVRNQQINIYLPSNSRDVTALPNTNGHYNGNGKH